MPRMGWRHALAPPRPPRLDGGDAGHLRCDCAQARLS